MVFVVLVTMEAGESNSFDCYGPVRKRASAMCRAFVTSRQLQDPPSSCCMAYRTLAESVKTTAERRQLCSCVQQLANNHELHRDAPINTRVILVSTAIREFFNSYSHLFLLRYSTNYARHDCKYTSNVPSLIIFKSCMFV